jgi:hypothetical protein
MAAIISMWLPAFSFSSNPPLQSAPIIRIENVRQTDRRWLSQQDRSSKAAPGPRAERRLSPMLKAWKSPVERDMKPPSARSERAVALPHGTLNGERFRRQFDENRYFINSECVRTLRSRDASACLEASVDARDLTRNEPRRDSPFYNPFEFRRSYDAASWR